MVVGGTSTFQKENISIPAPSLPLVERERPKTSISNHSRLKKRSITADTKGILENGQQPIHIIQTRPSSACRTIPNGNISRHITISTQTENKNYQQLFPSKCNVSTQTIIEDIRQSIFLEAYQPPLITEINVKRPRTRQRRRRETKNVDEIEATVIDDLPSSTNPSAHVPSRNQDPFDPEFCRQRQAAIDNMDYRKRIISWKATSLDEVINLIKNLSMDKHVIDRAWIVFYWVSQNIEYDVNSFFSGNIRHQTSDDVFRNKKGVCDAYGTIFKALCDGVQLKCVKVSGYAKGYGYVPGKSTFTQTDHAWNVVRLNNQWYFIDSTWGAGHVDTHSQYQKTLNPHYFLTRPEHMIYDHLPENSKWQLLSPPVSMQQFLLLPYVYSTFFDLQLEIVSPRNTSMVAFDIDRDLAGVLIRAPSDVRLSCSVVHDQTSGLVQYDADRQLWQCLFRPRASGHQTLSIYGRQGQSTGFYDGAIEFGLKMPNMVQFKQFPLTYGTFTTNKCQIFEPLLEKLKRGTKVTIHCRIPSARCVCLAFDGTLSSQEHHPVNDIFKQQITVPNQEVTVYVKFTNNQKSNSYDGLFKYTVE
jgi:transglutaminase-like putative cysteine protease